MTGTSHALPKKLGPDRSPPRKEDIRLLRGRARFVDDVHLDRMLHGVFIRSPHAHAEIGSVDATAAVSAGARLVLTARELPFIDRPWVVRYWHPSIRNGMPPFLADGVVRFVGEPVALLVADDRYMAEDLALLVEIDYRPLPVVADVEAARATGAPRLHQEWPNNVAASYTVRLGDADRALRGAERRLTHSVRFPRQVPVPLETRGAVADFQSARQSLTVWLSTQAHYNVRENLAQLLDLPEENVRVVCEDVGGGFGSKSRTYCEELVVSHASRVLARPVKWIEDRAESFQATTHSRGIETTMELGYAADGRFDALKATITLDVGAYVFTSGIATVELAGALATGAYRIADVALDVVVVGTNKTPIATYRGAGQPEAALAIETLVDRIANELDIDAAEIRRRNLIAPDDLPWRTGTRFGGMEVIFDSGDFPAMVERAIQNGGYTQAIESAGDHERCAWGMACGADGSGFVNFESARIRIDPRGDIVVHSGMTSQGQGQATTFAQICAEVLGTNLERISVLMGDTALLPFGRGAFASRGAIFGGNAVHGAARRLRDQVLTNAAQLLQCESHSLSIADGRIVRGGAASETGLTIGDIASAVRPGGALFRGAPALEEQFVYGADQPLTMGMSVHAAKVAVDTETGRVRLLDYFVVHDVGRALNPVIVDGQVRGGVVEGIGNALLTEMVHDALGQPMTTTLADYLTVTSMDAAKIRLDLMDARPATNPLGVRGIGESGTIAPPAAILNALARATGGRGRLTTVPATPERTLEALGNLITPEHEERPSPIGSPI